MGATQKKKVLILGCTGSIGQSSIELMREYPNDFEVVGLTAHTNEAQLTALGREFNCTNLFLSGLTNVTGKKNSNRFGDFRNNFDDFHDFIEQTEADIAINGISGFAGLAPSLSCLEAHMDIALANKESIVCAWDLLKTTANKNNKMIIPVDSEHSALFALVNSIGAQSVKQVVLTASGGPFRLLEKEKFSDITVEEALAHPTWSMGHKITIDSATLANKGLEVIEAAHLFSMKPENITVVIHPQSIVHSMIQSKDGVYYAQLSPPSMKQPIFYALHYPNVRENTLKTLDFSQALSLEFSPPRINAFPMLALAYDVLKKGNAYPIAYNAANEVFVHSFLKEHIRFIDIPILTEKILNNDWSMKPKSYSDVLEIDTITRKKAGALL